MPGECPENARRLLRNARKLPKNARTLPWNARNSVLTHTNSSGAHSLQEHASNDQKDLPTLKMDTCDTNCTLKLASNHIHANYGSTVSRVALRNEKINLQLNRKNLNCCLMRVKIAFLRRPAQSEKISVLRDPAAQPKKAVSMPIQRVCPIYREATLANLVDS